MLNFLFSMAFYVAISNWMYDDLVAFDPSLQDPLDEIAAVISIPTHHHWFDDAGEDLFAGLEREAQDLKRSVMTSRASRDLPFQRF